MLELDWRMDMKKFLIICCCLFFLVGCNDSTDDRSINYMDAKEKIINENALLVDVRTEEEYNADHIEGAVLFTLDDISADTAEDIIKNKNDVVIVYCQSGNRSNQALDLLVNLGYTEVYDLGAMSNWKE